MIKVVAVLKAKVGLSRDEFLYKWNVEHPVLVRKLPGLRRYRQNPAIEHHKEWPFNGMAELWFDSVADVKAAYAGVEAQELFEHEHEFLADMQWFLADEVEIDLEPGEAARTP
ncbi:EthD family reductase [Paenarthrobacter sp. PAE-2]|uniref:EthD family reductase n=1 Tax=Paenarthrobacter sp. PAE-2 TaxID=2982532 RepID=UPI002231FF4D|nr:EthD family reductase [Paenarthrobacter sp. PAE-2]MCW3768067.1 EthD family reductase [Paenarthrobacter sp. PAE-2]